MGDGVMVKLRLDYLLMRGHSPKIRDSLSYPGCDFKIHKFNANCFKELTKASGDYSIKSFAPRKNNGLQPVPDDFPVTWSDGCTERNSIQLHWDSYIKSWKPWMAKLIEQQIEYDKQQEQSIEELMINAKGNNMPIYTQEMKDAGKYAPIGSKVQIVNTSSFDLEYGEDVLGLEVTVKSEPISIGKGNIIQVVEYENIAYCFETDMISQFKSQEEIETEEAKEKQISKLCERYPHVKVKLFIEMQNNGDLAEIILPLESN